MNTLPTNGTPEDTTMPMIIPTAVISSFRKPADVLSEATEASKALQEILRGKSKPVIFNKEQYLEFEDWQTVGKFYGVCAKTVETKSVDFDGVRGFEARAVVIDIRTGMEISAADSMCLSDEPNWSKKPLFQLRSMAQTRACAKALRNVLAWVVVLAGYKPTPAEEMEGMTTQAPVTATVQRASTAPKPVVEPSEPTPEKPASAVLRATIDWTQTKTIAAKFTAPCKCCARPIEQGTEMLWVTGGATKGAYHKDCVSPE